MVHQVIWVWSEIALVAKSPERLAKEYDCSRGGHEGISARMMMMMVVVMVMKMGWNAHQGMTTKVIGDMEVAGRGVFRGWMMVLVMGMLRL